MTDFVFSQLEDISNDTFSDFSPYSPSCYYGDSPDHSCSPWNSTTNMDNSFCENYDYGSGDFMSDDVYMAHQEFTSTTTTMNNNNHNSNHNSNSNNNNNNNNHNSTDNNNYIGGELFPEEIKLRDIDMQDHNGQQLEHRRIADIKLKLFAHFFGLEYNDSFVGKAVSQFFPGDIITVVRQCDRIGIFIQFRRFLTCRKFNDSLYNGYDQVTSPSASNSEHLYFKDSPFVNCMYMMLEFVDEYHINYVFNYLVSNDRISSNLKMVYNQWMFCAEICTASDVHLISLSLSSGKGDNGKYLQTAINVNSSCEAIRDDEDERTEDEVDELADRMGSLSIPTPLTTAKSTPQLPTTTRSKQQTSPRRRLSNSSVIDHAAFYQQQQQRKISWAKSAISNAQKAKNGIAADTSSSSSVVQIRKKSLSNSQAVISASKMEEVLPPSFALISSEVKEFALQLLREAHLQPFQFSVRLCETLAIAQTPQAKMRAKSVLYKLSTYPIPVQLSNASQVARYILGQSAPSSKSTKAAVSPVPNTNATENNNNNLPSLQTGPSVAAKTKPQRSPQPIHRPPQSTKLDHEKLHPPASQSKTTTVSPAAEQTNKRKNSLTLTPHGSTSYGGESPLSSSGKQQNACIIS